MIPPLSKFTQKTDINSLSTSYALNQKIIKEVINVIQTPQYFSGEEKKISSTLF